MAENSARHRHLNRILPGNDDDDAEDTIAMIRVCQEGLQRRARHAHEYYSILQPYETLSRISAILVPDKSPKTFAQLLVILQSDKLKRLLAYAKNHLVMGHAKYIVEKRPFVNDAGALDVHDELTAFVLYQLQQANKLGKRLPTAHHLTKLLIRNLDRGEGTTYVAGRLSQAQTRLQRQVQTDAANAADGDEDKYIKYRGMIEKILKKDFHIGHEKYDTNPVLARKTVGSVIQYANRDDLKENNYLGGQKVMFLLDDLQRLVDEIKETRITTRIHKNSLGLRYNALIVELERLAKMIKVNLLHFMHRMRSRFNNARWSTRIRVLRALRAESLDYEELQSVIARIEKFFARDDIYKRFIGPLQTGYNFNALRVHRLRIGGVEYMRDVSLCRNKGSSGEASPVLASEDYAMGVRLASSTGLDVNVMYAYPRAGAYVATRHLSVARRKAQLRGDNVPVRNNYGHGFLLRRGEPKIDPETGSMRGYRYPPVHIPEIFARFILEKDAIRRGVDGVGVSAAPTLDKTPRPAPTLDKTPSPSSDYVYSPSPEWENVPGFVGPPLPYVKNQSPEIRVIFDHDL